MRKPIGAIILLIWMIAYIAVAAVVVVVRLGEVRLEAIRQTVDAVGRDKVLATVSVG